MRPPLPAPDFRCTAALPKHPPPNNDNWNVRRGRWPLPLHTAPQCHAQRDPGPRSILLPHTANPIVRLEPIGHLVDLVHTAVRLHLHRVVVHVEGPAGNPCGQEAGGSRGMGDTVGSLGYQWRTQRGAGRKDAWHHRPGGSIHRGRPAHTADPVVRCWQHPHCQRVACIGHLTLQQRACKGAWDGRKDPKRWRWARLVR